MKPEGRVYHCIRRAKERYRVNLRYADIRALDEQLKATGKINGEFSVYFKGQNFKVYAKGGFVVTFLPLYSADDFGLESKKFERMNKRGRKIK